MPRRFGSSQIDRLTSTSVHHLRSPFQIHPPRAESRNRIEPCYEIFVQSLCFAPPGPKPCISSWSLEKLDRDPVYHIPHIFSESSKISSSPRWFSLWPPGRASECCLQVSRKAADREMPPHHEFSGGLISAQLRCSGQTIMPFFAILKFGCLF